MNTPGLRGKCVYPLQQHITRDLEDHDEEEHELVSKIYSGLSYTDICGEASCEGTG